MTGDHPKLIFVVTFMNFMDVLDICQEAVNTGFISADMASKLSKTLWCNDLMSVELATLEFISRRIKAGTIKVAPESFRQVSRELHQVN